MQEWRQRSLTLSVVGALFAGVCVGDADSSGDDDAEVVELSALVPVLLTEANHLQLGSRDGPLPLTSDTDNYEEAPTSICDEQIDQVELVADADLYVYFGGRDNVILDEWVSGERVSAAVERYTSGVVAMDECVDAGSFGPVETSYPGIDEARRYEQLTVVDDGANQQHPEDNDRYHTWLYARNGGVIMLLSFGLGRREDYSDDLIERMIGTALGKLASIGRVQVATTSSPGEGATLVSDGVELTLPALGSDPSEAVPSTTGSDAVQSSVLSSEPLAVTVPQMMLENLGMGSQPSPELVATVEVMYAALLTVEDLGSGWDVAGAAWVLPAGSFFEPFRSCPDGDEMAVPSLRGFTSFLAEWTGEYNVSRSDDIVSESVYEFSEQEDLASWFAGAGILRGAGI